MTALRLIFVGQVTDVALCEDAGAIEKECARLRLELALPANYALFLRAAPHWCVTEIYRTDDEA